MPSSDTQWKPGQSGNPLGGKLSSKRRQLFKQLVEPLTKELVDHALSIALSDSKDRTKVLAIFLERVLPAVIKDNELPDEIYLSDGSLIEQANHIKRLISDKHITPEQGQVLLANVRTTAEIKYKEKVAIVCSGPAGLSCAYYLKKLGYPVTIFEAHADLGGMLRVGIPQYRLSREVLDIEVQRLRHMGVEIRTNTRVVSLDLLFEMGYKSIFITIGAHQSLRMGIEGFK